MKRIYMGKYGFERCANMDFSDDGNYFEVWKAGDLHVTKCVSEGYVCIAGRPDYNEKFGNYRVYSQVEGYKVLDILNGISINLLDDQKLQKFYDACITFTKNAENHIKTIKLPSEEELNAKAKELAESYNNLLKLVKEEIQKCSGIEGDVINYVCTLEDWTGINFMRSYKGLYKGSTEVFLRAKKVAGTYSSLDFIERRPVNEDEFGFKNLMEIIHRNEQGIK